MGSKNLTVETLARIAGKEIDDVLVTLWDGGFDLKDSTSIIPRGRTNQARRLIGIATKQDLVSIQYWEEHLGLDSSEFRDLCNSLDITLGSTRKLPKGAVKKLKKESQKRNKLLQTKPQNESLQKAKQLQPFELKSIGNIPSQLFRLTEEEVLGIHNFLVKDFLKSGDPIEPSGIKNKTLLSSAVHRQMAGGFGVDKYGTVELNAAALTHSLAHNHAFHNGNKRTALVSMIVVLEKNGRVITCDQDKVFKFILQATQHRIVDSSIPRESPGYDDREVHEIASWIIHNSRAIELGDRPIAWRRLEKILKGYNCSITYSGNKVHIERKPETKKFQFLRAKAKPLKCTVQNPDKGGDAHIPVIKRIRKQLDLEEVNGVDSKSFYEKEPSSIDDFVNQYRKTLNRLARL